MNDESQIKSVVASLRTGDDHMAFLTAATLNLYGEALRRVHSKALYSAQDAVAVARIISILYERTMEVREDTTIRTRELTPDEQAQVLKGVTEEAEKPEEEPKNITKFNQGRRV